jgi:hypothetical protein
MASARAAILRWVRATFLGAAAAAALGGLVTCGALAVLLMLEGDVLTAAVMAFAMGTMGMAAVFLGRDARQTLARTRRREALGPEPTSRGAPPRNALKPPAKLL